MTFNNNDSLKFMMQHRALKYADFVLASGQKSSYHFDMKQVLFCSEFAGQLGERIYKMTENLSVTTFGGLETGAIPMATATIVTYRRYGLMAEGFFVRKEPKTHGSSKSIEGFLTPGRNVCILDDVLTTGQSAMKAIKAVEAVGCKVVKVICIVDRLGGAAELLKDYNYTPLYTTREFGLF
jgi:orotate phosphoribosyltransferase